MPREKKSLAGSNEPQPQEEMTVVVMRFRGSGDTLQKGFDTVSQALAALGPPQPPVQQRVLVQRPAAQLPAGPDVIDAEAREAEDDEFEPAAAEPAASNGRPKPSRTRPSSSGPTRSNASSLRATMRSPN